MKNSCSDSSYPCSSRFNCPDANLCETYREESIIFPKQKEILTVLKNDKL